MAIPTEVNGQITDSITQINIEVLGNAPAAAMGALYQSAGGSAGITIQNAAANQQNSNSLSAAVLSAAIEGFLKKK